MSSADRAEATRRDDPAPRFPTLKAAEAYRLRFKRARRFVVDGKPVSLDEAAVIDVTTDLDWPAMGTGLVLFVDRSVLIESEQLGPKRYRFIAPPGAAWKGGALLALGLGGSGVPKLMSASKLKLPALDANTAARRE